MKHVQHRVINNVHHNMVVEVAMRTADGMFLTTRGRGFHPVDRAVNGQIRFQIENQLRFHFNSGSLG